MSNPAAQPRRLFLASVVLLGLIAMVALLGTGHLLPAVGVGLVAVVALLAGTRPAGQTR
jgi:hypothetical protein